MSELRELYQEMILDHGKRPRHHRRLAEPTHTAEGHNPLCGDRLVVDLRVAGGRLDEVGFEASGCAISVASASLMAEALLGRDLAEAERVFDDFHDLVTGKVEPDDVAERLDKLVVFTGVRAFPVRVKCATLPWHTLRAALAQRGEAVTTE